MATTYASDFDSRSVTTGTTLGTAATGGAWSTAFTSASLWSVSSQIGRFGPTPASGSRGNQLSIAQADVDYTADFRWDTNAAGGGFVMSGFVRYTDTDNYLRFDLSEVASTGIVRLSIVQAVAGAVTIILTDTQILPSYATNTWIRVRFRANGTTASVKGWRPDTEAEPSAWLGTATTSVTAAGSAGFRINNNSASTVTPSVQLRNLLITNPVYNATDTKTGLASGESGTITAGALPSLRPGSDAGFSSVTETGSVVYAGRRQAVQAFQITFQPKVPPPFEEEQRPEWRFTLWNRDGVILDQLRASERKVHFQINGIQYASCKIPARDTAAQAVTPGYSRMKVHVDGRLVFHGKITLAEWQLAGDDEWYHLEAMDALEGFETSEIDPLQRGSVRYSGTDAEAFLVDRYNSTTIGDGVQAYNGANELVNGNTSGNLPDRTIKWTGGTNLLDCLNQLTTGRHPVEYVTRPVEGDIAYDEYTQRQIETITALDVYYPEVGTDRAGSVFSYHSGPGSNLSDLNYLIEPRLVANEVIAQGKSIGKRVRYADYRAPTSRKTYGTRFKIVTRDEQRSVDALALAARNESTPAPPTTLTATPAQNAPQPFRDFELGDTVYIHVEPINLHVPMRMTSFDVEIDNDGNATLGQLQISTKDDAE